jgi:hypothetical protein
MIFGDSVSVGTRYSCTIGTKHAIGSEIILMHPMELQGDVVVWNLILVHLETVLVSVQDRRTVCLKLAIGSEIVSDAPDGTPR